mmetsp:Transcript_16658/g.29758  ORF Transcript_16658/g.29758 Transcript_16658/m.29758 type:complete len:126 (-) Transcript_16658:337-714(-)
MAPNWHWSAVPNRTDPRWCLPHFPPFHALKVQADDFGIFYPGAHANGLSSVDQKPETLSLCSNPTKVHIQQKAKERRSVATPHHSEPATGIQPKQRFEDSKCQSKDKQHNSGATDVGQLSPGNSH